MSPSDAKINQSDGEPRSGGSSTLINLGALLVLVALVAASFRSILTFGLLQDARDLILNNPYIVDGARTWQNLTNDLHYAPGWDPVPYWRPLVRLSWMAEVSLVGAWTGGYHLVSLSWHLLGVCGVFLVARRGLDMPLSLALAAGALFGLHPVAAQPTCVVLARADVAVTTCVIWAVAAMWIWSRRGGAWWMLLHLVAAALALGHKEAGLVVAPICTVAAVAGAGLRGVRLRGVLPAWALTALYLALRMGVLGPGSLELSLAGPLHWLAGWSLYQLNLLNLVLEAPTRDMSYAEARSTARLTWFMAILLFNVGLLGLLLARKELRGISIMAWLTLAAAPVLLAPSFLFGAGATGYEGKVVVTCGWVYLALPAAALLPPFLVHRLGLRPVTLIFLGACFTWSVICASILSPLAHSAFADDMSHLSWLDRRQDRIPLKHRTQQDTCGWLKRQIPRQVERGEISRLLELERRALQSCGPDLRRSMQVVAALVTAGRYDQASHMTGALVRPPDGVGLNDGRAHELAGIVAMERGESDRALNLLDRAVFLGVRGCGVHWRRLKGARLLKRPARAASAAEAIHACLEGMDPDPLLEAMELWLDAGDVRRARGLVPTLKSHYPMSPPNRKRLEALIDRLDRAAGKAQKKKRRRRRRRPPP